MPWLSEVRKLVYVDSVPCYLYAVGGMLGTNKATQNRVKAASSTGNFNGKRASRPNERLRRNERSIITGSLCRNMFQLNLHQLRSSGKKSHRCRVHAPQISHFKPPCLFAFFHQADARLYDFLEDYGAEEDGNEDTQDGQDGDQQQEQGATQASGL